MTLVYSVAHDDCAQILSDGAHYLPDGTLVDISSKIFASPWIPLAAVSAGSTAAGNAVCEAIVEISAIGSFDLAITMAAEIVPRMNGMVPEGHDFMLIIAGISETRGPCQFMALTKSAFDMPAYTLLDAGKEVGSGAHIDAAALKSIGITPEIAQASGSDFLRSHGGVFADWARHQKGKNWLIPDDWEPIYGIGGFLELTTITPDGCETERLMTWHEDQVGHKIQPLRQVAEAA